MLVAFFNITSSKMSQKYIITMHIALAAQKQTVNLIPTMDVREKMLQASYLTTLIQSMDTQRRAKISTIPCFQICWCVLIHRCWRPHKVASWSQDPIELEEEHATYLKSNIKLWSPAPQTSGARFSAGYCSTKKTKGSNDKNCCHHNNILSLRGSHNNIPPSFSINSGMTL
jgi:hypothetical protein